jgi:MoaA/NifB/PqqE/SkfB family radical SAM enzyme
MRTDKRLDLSSKIYQRTICRDAQRVASGATLKRPLVIELDPTTFCDFECPECISGTLLNQGRFTTKRIIELASEFVDLGVKAVIFIGGGEPLAHPGVSEAIRILGEGGLAIGVTTNGTLLHRYRDVLGEYASWTRVSVDAGSSQIFERFRPHRSKKNIFEKVVNNMRAFARNKKGALGYSFLVITRSNLQGEILETNACDVFRAGVLAKDIGCDYFEVKPSYDMGHFLVDQPEEIISSLKEQMVGLEGLEDERFKIVKPQTLSHLLAGAPLVQPKVYTRCLVSELRTLVTPKGAYICPYHRGDETRSYGITNTTSFEELWSSSARERVMDSTDPSRDCQFHCIRHESNLALETFKERDNCTVSNDAKCVDYFI